MRVFIYEFVTGGGMFCVDASPLPSGSLLREGAAMVSALASDFSALPNTEVTALRDGRLENFQPDCHRLLTVGSNADEAHQLGRLAAASDWTVMIAPEFDRLLETRCRRVETSGGRLLSPAAEFVAWAADKQRTAVDLQARGVPVARGLTLATGDRLPADFDYPAVLKPRDGAGSLDVRLLPDRRAATRRPPVDRPMRLEQYCDGVAASIALLCGPQASVLLPACRQRLSEDGQFRYLGGELLTNRKALRQRAERLAGLVVQALPSLVGYVGIDIVLGTCVDGSEDVVIEVNPRLTTSYVGLRAAAESNLAGAMLAVARGSEPRLRFRSQELAFDADGKILLAPQVAG